MGTLEPRRWVAIFLATTLAGIAALSASNFLVNPLGYYPTHFLPPLVWSSRNEKVALLRRRPSTEVLIVGSSRSMKLAPHDFESLAAGPTFNASVDSARVEDWNAIVRYAVETCRIPLHVLVVGMDLEAFRNDLEPDPRLVATAELRPFLPTSLTREYCLQAARALVELDQTRQTLRSLRLHFRGYPEPDSRFDADGFLHHVAWERQIAAGTFVPDFTNIINNYDERFAGYTSLDPARRATFESLLDYAREHRVRVRGFITPVSPRLLEHLRARRDFDRLRAQLLRYLDGQRTEHPEFSYVDLSELASWHGDPDGFLDAAHTDDANSRRLVQAVWNENQIGMAH